VILSIQIFLTHVRKIEYMKISEWSYLREYNRSKVPTMYFQKRLKRESVSKKEKYRYKGKNPAGLEGKRRPISKWWRKKADTRSPEKEKSSGAKRRIQGCYSSGSKEKWGRFLNKNFHIVLTWVKIFLMNLNEIY